MIAEFDAMVGEYITAVDDAGLTSRTVFVVTSDHGDMDMVSHSHSTGALSNAKKAFPWFLFWAMPVPSSSIRGCACVVFGHDRNSSSFIRWSPTSASPLTLTH